MSRIDGKISPKSFLEPNLNKMKKNLLFALSVFLLTIASLLLFTQSTDNKKPDTSKIEKLEFKQETSDLVSLRD